MTGYLIDRNEKLSSHVYKLFIQRLESNNLSANFYRPLQMHLEINLDVENPILKHLGASSLKNMIKIT